MYFLGKISLCIFKRKSVCVFQRIINLLCLFEGKYVCVLLNSQIWVSSAKLSPNGNSERLYPRNIFEQNSKNVHGIKEVLIMRISTTNMHNLAVKRYKIVKISSPNSAIREIKSPRNLKFKFNPGESLSH